MTMKTLGLALFAVLVALTLLAGAHALIERVVLALPTVAP
jgi:hypothetical protein